MKIKFPSSISAQTLSCGGIWHVTGKILKNISSDLYADKVLKDYSAVQPHQGLHVPVSCCTVVALVTTLSERGHSPVGFASLEQTHPEGAGLWRRPAKPPKPLKLSC